MHETIRRHELLRPGQQVLVGLSGGPDSWALVLALQRLSERLQIGVQAACVDHGLRPESAEEAAGVQAACEARGLTCHLRRVDVRAHRTAHVSWQDAARRARLRALGELAALQSCDVVALGHTAEDQAETILFRIVRGTGLRGLAGIPYRRDVFIRPLLDVHRAEVERFVARAGIEPVRDPSNQDPRYTRVRVRQIWLPLLRQENPKVVEALLALASEARALGGTPEAPAVAGAPPLSRRQAAAVARRQAAGGSGAISVAGGRVEVSYGRASFVKADGEAGAGDPPASAAPLTVPALPHGRQVQLSPGGPRLNLELRTQVPDRRAGFATFDADQIVWPLTIRTWRAGDHMRPRGGRGTRKLQDLFVDAKVPRSQRQLLPVLADAEGVILFVPGLRPSAHAVPGEETRRCLVVHVVGAAKTS